MITIPPRPPETSLRDWLLDNDILPPRVNRVDENADGSLTVLLFEDAPESE